VNLNDPMLGMTGARSRIAADLARYARTEYGDDDPTWLLSQIRAPPKGARSFSHTPRRPLASLRRAARALGAILL